MNAADGGPAFPVDQIVARDEKGRVHGHEISSAGLSIRDYFAAKALHAMLINGENSDLYTETAARAYWFADEMLAARKGGAS